MTSIPLNSNKESDKLALVKRNLEVALSYCNDAETSKGLKKLISKIEARIKADK